MTPETARKTWRTAEPIHAFIYFLPEASEAYESLGSIGPRTGYFASRSAWEMGTTVRTHVALNGGQQFWLAAAAFIGLTIYLSYAWSERLERLLGESAINVFLRLSSFLLLCIGVQILANGIKALKIF